MMPIENLRDIHMHNADLTIFPKKKKKMATCTIIVNCGRYQSLYFYIAL